MKKRIKLVLFFNHSRGVEVLKTLIKENYEIKKIFLSKKNLDKKILPFLKKNALNYNIINNVNESKIVSYIKKNNIDFNIIAGFPYIFKKDLLNSVNYATLNLHGGRLPKYKGASTLNWQIINGERKIGISIIKANEKIDQGSILGQSDFRLKENHDISDVHRIANIKFAKLLSKVLIQFIRNKIIYSRNTGGKIYKQRNISDGLILWQKMNKEEVFNFVRAITNPYPGAFSFLKNNNKKITIFKCKPYKCLLRYKPGFIFYKKNYFFVKCKKGCIKLLKFEGKINSGYSFK
ncbi:formyltransferase family protein [Candidatus Pelagibacter sp.]|jgi:methionyl-tRNA formyltransferase|nr:formyltransferase family protein [Candidatus Pelagibacter sp.]